VLHGFALVDFQCFGPLKDSHIVRATDVQKKAVSVYRRLLYASRPTNARDRSGVPIAWLYSLRQLLANAATAASRVGS
jgi:hypothetical protein